MPSIIVKINSPTSVILASLNLIKSFIYSLLIRSLIIKSHILTTMLQIGDNRTLLLLPVYCSIPGMHGDK
ncbi:hypothetical protein L873DRAFT_1817182 [Choiromyces venosus 120613-1]|uniref:Uncharacterized protein n=1 Tax=Choiromyces venosus 120613-1 TaxID=1336337 RepID=A0A3N4J356_9PEZI|nr:hypothetical protein L873DRAFT_1817182 [Choiromyces venosus 120613-1]